MFSRTSSVAVMGMAATPDDAAATPFFSLPLFAPVFVFFAATFCKDDFLFGVLRVPALWWCSVFITIGRGVPRPDDHARIVPYELLIGLMITLSR